MWHFVSGADVCRRDMNYSAILEAFCNNPLEILLVDNESDALREFSYHSVVDRTIEQAECHVILEDMENELDIGIYEPEGIQGTEDELR